MYQQVKINMNVSCNGCKNPLVLHMPSGKTQPITAYQNIDEKRDRKLSFLQTAWDNIKKMPTSNPLLFNLLTELLNKTPKQAKQRRVVKNYLDFAMLNADGSMSGILPNQQQKAGIVITEKGEFYCYSCYLSLLKTPIFEKPQYSGIVLCWGSARIFLTKIAYPFWWLGDLTFKAGARCGKCLGCRQTQQPTQASNGYAQFSTAVQNPVFQKPVFQDPDQGNHYEVSVPEEELYGTGKSSDDQLYHSADEAYQDLKSAVHGNGYLDVETTQETAPGSYYDNTNLEKNRQFDIYGTYGDAPVRMTKQPIYAQGQADTGHDIYDMGGANEATTDAGPTYAMATAAIAVPGTAESNYAVIEIANCE